MGKRVKAQGTTGPETPSGTGAPEHQEDAHLACGHEVSGDPGGGCLPRGSSVLCPQGRQPGFSSGEPEVELTPLSAM